MKVPQAAAILLGLFLVLQSCAPDPGDKKVESHPDIPGYLTNEAQVIDRLLANRPGVDSIYQQFAREEHIPGMIYGIVRHDSLLWVGSIGNQNVETQTPVTSATAFRIASMTKSFTAMAILHLRDAGKLALTDPVTKYLPEWKPSLPIEAPPVTLYHLLTMTAGFPEDNPWGDRQLQDTESEFLEFLKQGISFSTEPGTEFEYSNLGYAMLGQVISRVSGISYQQYIRQNILQPLGMKHTYWDFEEVPPNQLALGYRFEDERFIAEPILHDGVYGAMGGLITTLGDFSQYVRFHLSAYHGKYPDYAPIKRSSLREMHQPTMPRLNSSSDSQGHYCAVMTGYGFGLGIRKMCTGLWRISHSGGLPGYGSEYRFYPDYNLGIISFTNLTYGGNPNGLVMEYLIDRAQLEKSVLGTSAILQQRQQQVLDLLQNWNMKDTTWIAENFFLDRDVAHRKKDWESLLAAAGTTGTPGMVVPENALRGTFVIPAEHGQLKIFFTLSPENPAKLQMLEMSFDPAVVTQ